MICFIFHIEVCAVMRETCLECSLLVTCVTEKRVSQFYHLSQLLHEENVFQSPENGMLLPEGKQRVSPFCHNLNLDLVGLIGNFWIG